MPRAVCGWFQPVPHRSMATHDPDSIHVAREATPATAASSASRTATTTTCSARCGRRGSGGRATGTPARRSTPSPTPARCPTVAEASRPRIREWSPRPFTAASGPRPRIVRPFRPSTVPIAAASGWVAAESALERLQGLKHAHLGLNLLLHAPQTRSLQRSRTPRRGSGPSADRAGAGASKKVEARPQSPAKGPRRPQRATTRS